MRVNGEGYPQPERSAFTFGQMQSETGVLWMINRVLFHPRGYALAFEYAEGETEPRGWNVQGDGSEPWSFPEEMELGKFLQFEQLLTQAPTNPFSPPAPTEAPPPTDRMLG